MIQTGEWGEADVELGLNGPIVLTGAAPFRRADRYLFWDDEQAQAPDLPVRQPQLPLGPPGREVQMQEPEGEAESVPPEVHSGEVEEDRIDLVGVGSHLGSLPRQGSGCKRTLDLRHSDRRFATTV